MLLREMITVSKLCTQGHILGTHASAWSPSASPDEKLLPRSYCSNFYFSKCKKFAEQPTTRPHPRELEMKIQRKILGARRTNEGEYRRRMNRKIDEIAHRLRWCRHEQSTSHLNGNSINEDVYPLC